MRRRREADEHDPRRGIPEAGDGSGPVVVLPLFLFSATFYPIETYPPVLQVIVRLTPLYQGVDLIRSLTVGYITPVILFHVAYLAVLGFAGLFVVSRRLDKLLLT